MINFKKNPNFAIAERPTTHTDMTHHPIPSDLPIIIAGPCVIESASILTETAAEIARLRDKYAGRCTFIFKSSFDKANRTSYRSYRGPGIDKGLTMLAEIKTRFGLPILTDIHESHQAATAAQVADILQIPALLSRQTDLIAAAAATGRTINIKKGQFLSAGDMRFAYEKARESGGADIWLTERGNIFGYNDLVVDFRNIPRMKAFAQTVLIDCTHTIQVPNGNHGSSGGNPEYISSMALAGKAFGADGYFIETHPDPDNALSDGSSMLRLDRLEGLIDALI